MDKPHPSVFRRCIFFYSLLLIAITLWFFGGFRPFVRPWVSSGVALLLLLEGVCVLISKTKPRLPFFCLMWAPAIVYVILHIAFFSPTPWLASDDIILLIGASVFLFSAARSFSHASFIYPFFYGLVLLGVLEVGVEAYQYFIEAYWLPCNEQIPVYSGRSTGTFGNPNHCAAFLSLVPFPCAACFLKFKGNRLAQLLFALSFIALLLGLTLSSSRGALAGLAASAFAFPLLVGSSKKYKLKGLLGTAILLISMHFIAKAWVAVYSERVQYHMNHLSEDARFSMYSAAASIFKEHPLTGSGGGSYDIFYEGYRKEGFNHTPVWAHNEYLNTLSDYGLIGFALLFSPCFYLIFLLIKKLKKAKNLDSRTILIAVLLSLVSFGIHCLVDFNLRIPVLTWIVSSYLAIIFMHGPSLSLHSISFSKTTGFIFIIIALGFAYWAWGVNQSRSQEYRASKIISNQDQRTNQASLKHAISLLESSVALDPKNQSSWSLLSFSYYHLHRQQESELSPENKSRATLCALNATKLCSIDWFGWVSYGLASFIEKNYSHSVAAFRTAVELAPNNASAWYYYAVALTGSKDRPDKVIFALDRSLYLNPENASAQALREHWLKIYPLLRNK